MAAIGFAQRAGERAALRHTDGLFIFNQKRKGMFFFSVLFCFGFFFCFVFVFLPVKGSGFDVLFSAARRNRAAVVRPRLTMSSSVSAASLRRLTPGSE